MKSTKKVIALTLGVFLVCFFSTHPYSAKEKMRTIGLWFNQLEAFASPQLNHQSAQNTLPGCEWNQTHLVGRLAVDQSPVVDLAETAKGDPFLANVQEGGKWQPKMCKSRKKVAIIIPFRNRKEHLKILLRQLHPVLQRQDLDYRIFVIDQVDSAPFNRAKLLNVGYKESQRYDDYDCFVFHDVDLIPENDRNDYGCPSGPRHMSAACSKFNYKLFSVYLFGGVTSFRKEDFVKVNGYSNKYYGWGSEDDDMYKRIRYFGFTPERPSLEIGRYTMIKHYDEPRNGLAALLLKKAEKFLDKDGINTLRYDVITSEEYQFYTKISVDLLITKEEEKLTTLKLKKIQSQGKPRGIEIRSNDTRTI